MDDKITALIAEAHHYLTDGGPWRDEVRVAGLVRRLADALEAAVQAPAVDREALVKFFQTYGVPVARPELTAERWADALIASGILQDAREVEARALESFASREVKEFTLAEIGREPAFGAELIGWNSAVMAHRREALYRAQQVREGTA